MSEPIQPALEPWEWDDWGERGVDIEVPDMSQHAFAALCLDGQPFGFHWEDVRVLREVLEDFLGDGRPKRYSLGDHARAEFTLRSLANRIEALLRPQS